MKRTILKITIIFIVLTLGFYLVCYVLLQENLTSISSIITNSHNLTFTSRLLVLGLLPFYIAAIVFGVGILGIYIGSALHRLINRFKKNRSRQKNVY